MSIASVPDLIHTPMELVCYSLHGGLIEKMGVWAKEGLREDQHLKVIKDPMRITIHNPGIMDNIIQMFNNDEFIVFDIFHDSIPTLKQKGFIVKVSEIFGDVNYPVESKLIIGNVEVADLTPIAGDDYNASSWEEDDDEPPLTSAAENLRASYLINNIPNNN
ncbi:hypothetical protein BN7_3696 [Wickerhamomyces ciferrii]|uniref:Uncharacterized protein n=1 Tax=Wickerhamomyces ciferrii (strain ATCC 14091 / BCRC 22168 / CBS 111 / JCM 3599 / NBRC 0793 / NRRL Y-1031 F-60-10) TaxID=1206466 RepID=K0KS10_WICCF|nr:uncharacterized protein BN7_3696 [Wickerhamomyces ciferrii]CCH44138.1 hypothetical protein BN7_3696 [Wickerhamomyces ciferrii]